LNDWIVDRFVKTNRAEGEEDETAHQGLVGPSVDEDEVVDILGGQQVGDDDVILDRTGSFSVISAASRSPTIGPNALLDIDVTGKAALCLVPATHHRPPPYHSESESRLP